MNVNKNDTDLFININKIKSEKDRDLIIEKFLDNPTKKELGYTIYPLEDENYIKVISNNNHLKCLQNSLKEIDLGNITTKDFKKLEEIKSKTIKLKTGVLKLNKSKELTDLVDYGSRVNKNRGFLFISKVLGKHLPTRPIDMKLTYLEMAAEINRKIDRKLDTIVIGFAETATALGQGVFDALKIENSFYIHSTRYSMDKEVFFEFFEEHCHAPSHILYKPTKNKFLNLIKSAKNIILVDDEVTTGKTANNIVEQLKRVLPNAENFYLSTILNWSKKNYNNFEYISLYKGTFEFDADEKALSEILTYKSISDEIIKLDKYLPKESPRFGVATSEAYDFSKYVNVKDYNKSDKILVLGTSEFMYIPYLIADYLERNGLNVKYQATTRSPANIDGAIKSRIEFKDNYFENIDNFLYNVSDKIYDEIIICYETNELPENFDLKNQLINLGFKVKEIKYETK